MKIRVAKTFWERFRGLMLRSEMPDCDGLMFENCNAIHTHFMRFPIDATFYDANDKIVKVVRNIKPWKFCVYGGRNAVKVLETRSKEDDR